MSTNANSQQNQASYIQTKDNSLNPNYISNDFNSNSNYNNATRNYSYCNNSAKNQSNFIFSQSPQILGISNNKQQLQY